MGKIIFVIIVLIFITAWIIDTINAKRRVTKNLKLKKLEEVISNMMNRGTEKQLVGDYKSAVGVYDMILHLQPDNYEVLILRANCLEALNFNLDAINDYENALKDYQYDPNIYGLLGLTYAKVGNINQCLSNLKISIDKGLKIHEPMYNLYLNDFAKQKVIENGKEPNNLLKRELSDFQFNLAQVDKTIFKEAYINQFRYLETAISLDPKNIELNKLYESVKNTIEELNFSNNKL